MPAFQIYLNGKNLTTAGVENRGLLNAFVHWSRVAPKETSARKSAKAVEELSLQVHGLVPRSGFDESLRWVERNLKLGDEVCIRIVKSARVDGPHRRKRFQRPKAVAMLKMEKDLVMKLAKKFGWKIQKPKNAW